MLTFQMTVVIAGIIGMVAALVANKMRPGMVLFSVCVVFLCAKISSSPRESSTTRRSAR